MHDLALPANLGSTTTYVVCNSLRLITNQQLRSSWQQVQHGVSMLQGNPQLLGPTMIVTMTTQGKDTGYMSVGELSCQPNS
jgi:hypothetical protein